MSRIAIPSDDRQTIAKHFGRSKGFVIVNVKQDKVVDKVYINNTFTHHSHESNQASSRDIDSAKLHLHHEHKHEHKHSHEGIFKAIGDCDIVIAGGMGKRLYQEFMDKKVQVFISKEKDVDKALQMYLNNTLDSNTDLCCEH